MIAAARKPIDRVPKIPTRSVLACSTATRVLLSCIELPVIPIVWADP